MTADHIVAKVADLVGDLRKAQTVTGYTRRWWYRYEIACKLAWCICSIRENRETGVLETLEEVTKTWKEEVLPWRISTAEQNTRRKEWR